MKRWLGILSVIAVSIVLVGGAHVNAEQARGGDATRASSDARTACMELGAMKEADGQSMRDFMQSERAPEMMGRMMEMARRMGNGDTMAGMTRMMDMMGSSGHDGMMGGRGGMMGGGMTHPAPPSK